MKAQMFTQTVKAAAIHNNKKLLSRMLSANDDIVAFGTFSVFMTTYSMKCATSLAKVTPLSML